MTQSRTDQILDFAEHEIRRGGLDAVSFRDIARAVGIKSASVHYHFPTKGDLSAAVTRRYADRFLQTLGRPDDPTKTVRQRMERLARAYGAAYREDSATCLCAVLGAIMPYLPEETGHEVRRFFERLRDWVEVALGPSDAAMTPDIIVSVLQGAMVLAIASGTDEPMDEAERFLLGSL